MRWVARGIVLAWATCLVPAVLGGPASPPAYWVETIAGANWVGDGGPAIEAVFGIAQALALDPAGFLYVADSHDHRVRRIDLRTGIIDTVAGQGVPGDNGDGILAQRALLKHPYDVAVDFQGGVLVADFGNGLVRRIRPDGYLETIAGGNISDPTAPPARRLELKGPRNVAADRSGALFIAAFLEHRVYRIDPSGQVQVVAGNGRAGFCENEDARKACLNSPAGLALGPDGALYVADTGNHRVARIVNGRISTVFGPNEVALEQPVSVAFDTQGQLYVVDSSLGCVIVKRRDGRAGIFLAGLENPQAVALAPDGTLYLAVGSKVLRYRPGSALVELIAGGGQYGSDADGRLARTAPLYGPMGIGVSEAGELYVAEQAVGRVRVVRPDGTIWTVAKAGQGPLGWEDGSGPRLRDPVAVTVDASGNVWISDYSGNRIWRLDSTGNLSLIAGTGDAGYDVDQNLAARAILNRPRGIAASPRGHLFIADSANHRVRELDPAGVIRRIAGTGTAGYGGDGQSSLVAQLNTPTDVAIDSEGNLYIADSANHCVRKVRSDGLIETVAGTGAAGFSGEGGPAREAQLHSPSGVAVDTQGQLIIADTGNHRVRLVDKAGRIWTIAGDGFAGFTGETGWGHEVRLHWPADVAVGRDGSIFVVDAGNQRVRKLVPAIGASVGGAVPRCRVLHAATWRESQLAPGQLVSVFGDQIGPTQPVVARSADPPDSLAGVEVWVGDLRARLLYVSSGQINLQLPDGLTTSGQAEVIVLREGRPACAAVIRLAAVAPGLFTEHGGDGQLLALNADGTRNGPANPAPRGSSVRLYGTGLERLAAAQASQDVAASAIAEMEVDVRVGGIPVEVMLRPLQGSPGVTEILVRLPEGFVTSGTLPVEVWVGSVKVPQSLTLAVR